MCLANIVCMTDVSYDTSLRYTMKKNITGFDKSSGRLTQKFIVYIYWWKYVSNAIMDCVFSIMDYVFSIINCVFSIMDCVFSMLSLIYYLAFYFLNAVINLLSNIFRCSVILLLPLFIIDQDLHNFTKHKIYTYVQLNLEHIEQIRDVWEGHLLKWNKNPSKDNTISKHSLSWLKFEL